MTYEEITSIADITVSKYENNELCVEDKFQIYSDKDNDEIWIRIFNNIPKDKTVKILDDGIDIYPFECFDGEIRTRNSLSSTISPISKALILDNLNWIKEKLNSKEENSSKHWGGYVNGRYEINIKKTSVVWVTTTEYNPSDNTDSTSDDTELGIISIANKHRIPLDVLENVFEYWDKNDFPNAKKVLKRIQEYSSHENMIDLLIDILHYIHEIQMEQRMNQR